MTRPQTYTYGFDDIELTIEGEIVLASGSIDIEFYYCPAEPDVGIFYDGIEIDGYGALDIVLVPEDGTPTAIKGIDRTLAEQIAKALGEDHLAETINEA
jgi:hypothetical protein